MTGRDMHDDVLEPFIEEWMERARRAQEAVDALTSGLQKSRAPRLERRQGRQVLIRRDGEEARLRYGPDAREVTVVFTPEEWRTVAQVVLLQHGLTTLQMLETNEEIPSGE